MDVLGVMFMLWLVVHEGRATSSAAPCHVLRNGNGLGNFFWKHVNKSSCVVSMLSRDEKETLVQQGSWFLCAFERGQVHCAFVYIVHAEGECMQSSESTQGCFDGGWVEH